MTLQAQNIQKGQMTLIDHTTATINKAHLINSLQQRASGGSAANSVIAFAALGSAFYARKVVTIITATSFTRLTAGLAHHITPK
ncbi:MAG: hypothetical protein IPI79_15235 [Moraxellaceae bacterium]|nr:hypothetical protein [Moraxellaceae bacterium]